MNAAPEPVPNDVVALRAMLAEAWAERDAERAEKAQLASQNDRLRHLIRQLQRLQFGRRSEKLDPDQLNLGLEDVEQAVAETEAEQEKADPALKRARTERRRHGRGSLPEHLPRVEVVIEPENTACACCGRCDAGHWRRSFATARRDPGAVPGDRHAPAEICLPQMPGRGGAGAGAGAADRGRPADRAAGRACRWWRNMPITARCTANRKFWRARVSRSTDRPWPSGSAIAAAEIKPLWRLMREDLLRSTKLFVDETRAPVLDPGRGRTKTGYFWVLARDDRPWRGRAPPAVVYSYAPGRGGEHAIELLRGYTGVLQTDAYAAYRSLADPEARGQRGDACVLLGALAAAVVRHRQIAAGADRRRGPEADRRTLPDRGRDPRRGRR